MLHKHDKCYGICLLRLFKIYIELWICKPDAAIEEHYHEQQDNLIIYLFGKVKFFKRNYLNETERFMDLNWRNTFRMFRIKQFCYHRFENYDSWFVFINLANFYSNYKPVSASIDFKLTK